MLNPFFIQGTNTEQGLLQDLVNEQLKIYGIEVYYLPRKIFAEGKVIKEVLYSKFENAFPIEMYLMNYEGFDANSMLMSKFGVRITDEMTLIVSKERFDTYIVELMKLMNNIKNPLRPNEGDLIYVPLSNSLMEIKYVENRKPFYQLQKNYVYELKCELYEFEDENIQTGVETIDQNFKDVGHGATLTLSELGATATASATLVNGAIQYINLINSGYRYTSSPKIIIEGPPGIGATATAVGFSTAKRGLLSGQSLSKIYIENAGSGYAHTNPPSVSFFGGGGYGAEAVVGVSSRGAVGVVSLTSPGQGYTTEPTVTFSTPLGLGATVTAQVGAGGTIESLTIVGAGEFYSSVPPITIPPPGTVGTTATAEALVSAGIITATVVTNGGRFYRQDQNPVVTYTYVVGYATTIDTVTSTTVLYPDEVFGPFGPFDTQGFLNFYYPTATVNDAVLESDTGILWVFDGGTWNSGEAVTVGTATTIANVSFGSTILSIDTPSIAETILSNNVTVQIDAPVGSGLDPDFRAYATLTILNGSVNTVTLTNAGVGYTIAPVVTVPNTSQYKTPVGLTTATGKAFLNSSGGISTIRITNSGFGYVDSPIVTISNGTLVASGNFIFGETITGSISNASAVVKSWNSTTKKLEVSGLGTDFYVGDVIVGQTSNATYSLLNYQGFDLDLQYDKNDVIEEEADLIIDFSEINPFGEV
jgi:hypothetical protein